MPSPCVHRALVPELPQKGKSVFVSLHCPDPPPARIGQPTDPFLTGLKGGLMISRVLTCCLGLLLLIISAAISPARADTMFDQTNTELPLGTLSQNLLVFSPLGQSFTPTLS